MRNRQKPRIIVISEDDDSEGFKWMSDGWYHKSAVGTPKAEDLMEKACKCVAEGEDVPDVIRRLEKAGFQIRRASNQMTGDWK